MKFVSAPLFTYSNHIHPEDSWINFIHGITPNYYGLERETAVEAYINEDNDFTKVSYRGDTKVMTGEEILMTMLSDFNTYNLIEIPAEFLFLEEGNFNHYRTGILVGGNPVFIAQNKTDGGCTVSIGDNLIKHLQTRSILDQPSPF